MQTAIEKDHPDMALSFSRELVRILSGVSSENTLQLYRYHTVSYKDLGSVHKLRHHIRGRGLENIRQDDGGCGRGVGLKMTSPFKLFLRKFQTILF